MRKHKHLHVALEDSKCFYQQVLEVGPRWEAEALDGYEA